MVTDPQRFLGLRASLLLALGSLLAAPRVPAQENTPGVFAEIIDVRVVNLEAVVTDKDGIRVSGLGPEDFELRVDGEEVPITYFTEVLGGKAVAGREGETSLGLPSLAAGKAVETSYLVFVDEFFTIQRDRDRVLESLIEDLPLMVPGDRLAVVAFDGRRLEMLTSWTQSSSEVERVLEEAKRRPTQGLQRLVEQRTFRRNLADTRALTGNRFGTLDNSLGVEEERYAEELAFQIERVVSAASATLRGFASPPGRKVMLLFSGGWPFLPLEFAVGSRDRIFLEQGIPTGPELFEPLADTANRLGYTLYPVDVPGLDSDAGDVEFNRGSSGNGVADALGFEREQNVHSSLSFLTQETGGRALLNAGRLDSLPKVTEDTRSYYWLGFTPTWQGDDQAHDVKIRMRTKGLKVRSRESFRDLSRSTQVTNMVESAMLFGNSPSALPLALEFGRPKRAGIGKVKLPLTVQFPARDVVLLPTAKGYSAQLEIRIAAINEHGERSDIPVGILEVTRPEPPGEDLLLSFSTELKMRKGEHDVVVSIYDPASGALLSARKTIHP